ncbi:hypothetical protein [Oenococcus sicerae]|uniref:Uncharacterized protein n=1 Tax=Oenococcus sicerae TaxID=2203724 RepID=A0AAJ1VLJ1_9LACO|nr:hypothetical protein [Oenococcus sicerae]MDN6899543.1 hypothetical protein [Oenococcus sicerae]
MLREGINKDTINFFRYTTNEEKVARLKRYTKSFKQGIKFAKQSRERAGKQRKPVIATYLETGEQVELPSIKQASKRLHCSAYYAIKTGHHVQGYRLEYK